MRLFVLSISGVLIFTMAFGQSNCDCLREFEFVADYIEANAPSFQDNVDDANRKDYRRFRKQMAKNAERATGKTDCFKTLTYYVEFFKDNHTALYSYSEDVDEEDSASVADFLTTEAYQSAEQYELGDLSIQQYSPDSIRGIYRSQDGKYTVAVVPDSGTYRDYIGVISESKSPVWKAGQVRLELKRTKDKRWEAFTYQDDHSLSFRRDFPVRNGILGDQWFKTNLPNRTNPVTDVSDSLHFRMIADSIAYLRLPKFYTSQIKPIDSLVSSVDEQIKNTPYLIIDVRNNGGGSGVNARRLLDYYYSEPIREDQVELYVTEDNIIRYEDMRNRALQDTASSTAGLREWYSATVKRMKQAPLNSYITLSEEDQYIENDTVYKLPRKVAILYNKYCASSCELLLFWSDPGDKTLLVGENSGGYVGYGEALVIKTPCFGFNFPVTTTRYKRGRQYEADGIPPDYYLNYEEDWIDQTIEILAKQRTTDR